MKHEVNAMGKQNSPEGRLKKSLKSLGLTRWRHWKEFFLMKKCLKRYL